MESSSNTGLQVISDNLQEALQRPLKRNHFESDPIFLRLLSKRYATGHNPKGFTGFTLYYQKMWSEQAREFGGPDQFDKRCVPALERLYADYRDMKKT